MDFEKRVIVDSSYFSDWKQYNLSGLAFRRMPTPLVFEGKKISAKDNPVQVDRNLVPTEDSGVCYKYIVDLYVAASLINGGVDPGIFNPNNSDASEDAIREALSENGCYYPAGAGDSGLVFGNKRAPWWSVAYSQGRTGEGSEWPFWVPTDEELGVPLKEQYGVVDGVPIGQSEQGTSGVYNILINKNKTRGYFVARGSNLITTESLPWGVYVDIQDNVMRISASMWGYLPLPGSDLQQEGLEWLVPKLFFPYVSYGNGVIAVTWIGINVPDGGPGVNWFVKRSVAFGPTPSANYNHFFPCWLLQGITEDNGGIVIALEMFKLFGPNLGGWYNANGLLTQYGTVTITGNEDNATLTAADGTTWTGFNLSNNGTMATSPGKPDTYGSKWPRNEQEDTDG